MNGGRQHSLVNQFLEWLLNSSAMEYNMFYHIKVPKNFSTILLIERICKLPNVLEQVLLGKAEYCSELELNNLKLQKHVDNAYAQFDIKSAVPHKSIVRTKSWNCTWYNRDIDYQLELRDTFGLIQSLHSCQYSHEYIRFINICVNDIKASDKEISSSRLIKG